MKEAKMKITELKQDPQNPNRMDEADKERMAKSMAEFGDLSGVILNRRTGYLVGGHQRVDIMKGCEITTKELTKPEPDGTVARGYIDYNGRRMSLRVVDWPEEKAKAALIAANRFGRVGHDDLDVLSVLLSELNAGELDMDLTGYSNDALEQMMKTETPMKSVEVKPPPKMAWVLIGVPTGSWPKISGMAEDAAKIEGSIVETTVNDDIKEN